MKYLTIPVPFHLESTAAMKRPLKLQRGTTSQNGNRSSAIEHLLKHHARICIKLRPETANFTRWKYVIQEITTILILKRKKC